MSHASSSHAPHPQALPGGSPAQDDSFEHHRSLRMQRAMQHEKNHSSPAWIWVALGAVVFVIALLLLT